MARSLLCTARGDLIARAFPAAYVVAVSIALVPTASLQAQTATTVVVTGRASVVSVAGFGDLGNASAPFQASTWGPQQFGDAGVRSIGDLTRLDASLSEAYNAEGYWSIMSARGYTLDNRYNYRRDGLPINAETSIGLANKERLEVLKGASGIQAGTSAPGGLVNLVVKRPAGRIREVMLEVRQPGTARLAADIGDRYGPDGRVGLRFNAEIERREPAVRNTTGERALLAAAADFRLTPGTLLQAEVESSHQRQPSVAGFSMRGDTVPDPRSVDRRLNLNDQPWRQPVVMDGTTASVRLEQRIAGSWTATLHGQQQSLRTDDRTAFPYGVYDAGTYLCSAWCDRFAPDGSFTYWQFVSDNERRESRSLQLMLTGRANTTGIEHRIELGALGSRFKARFKDQIFDIAGTGRDDGSLTTPPSGAFTDANTDRDERTNELVLRDVIQVNSASRLWLGVRHTRLERGSERTRAVSETEGRQRTDYRQNITTPWLAATLDVAPDTLIYSSWGRGIESDVAPNRERYTNAGQALPALASRQFEVGLKHNGPTVASSIAFFDISRPQAADAGECVAPGSCTRVIDGSARHRGAEATGTLRLDAWTWDLGAMWLDAARRGATIVPVQNGLRPVNVPRTTLRLGAEYRPPAISGLALLAQFRAEGDRVVLPYDESARIAGWATLDLGLLWRQDVGGTALQWRLALDNAADRRAWKESPYQFSHVYLYPLTPRTWRASVAASF